MPVIDRTIRAAAVALACACAHPLAAQLSGIIPLSVEARGGIALPRGDFRGAADGGVAAEVSATWHALPMIGVYGAYQWNRFGWDGAGDPADATDAGWAAGVRLSLPTPLLPIDPWIRVGVVAHDLDAASVTDDTQRGWEAGAGLSFPLARGLALTPGLLWTRYQHGSGAADGELLHVRHLRADVGVRLRL